MVHLWSNMDVRDGQGRREPESCPCCSSRRTGFCCWRDSSQQTRVWLCSRGSVRLWLRWTFLCTAGQNFPPRKMSSFKPRQVPRRGGWASGFGVCSVLGSSLDGTLRPQTSDKGSDLSHLYARYRLKCCIIPHYEFIRWLLFLLGNGESWAFLWVILCCSSHTVCN